VKATPIATTHPGVMVLANVIDNLKNQRFLTQVPAWVQVATAWLGLLLMAWASYRIREDQIKWAVPVAPSLFLGLGYLGLNSGQNIFLDLTPSASHALLFFTAWTVYLSWRTRFFVQPAQMLSEQEGLSHETFAVLKMHFDSVDVGEILDHLPASASSCTVIQLGALGQLPHLQEGMVYVAIRTNCGLDGQTLLENMIGTLPHPPMAFFIGSSRTYQWEPNQNWGRIWEDTAHALHEWKDCYAKNE
jgi:hypothetical protein